MELQEFKDKLLSCKHSSIYTGHYNLRVVVNPSRTLFKITKKADNRICQSCGTDLTKLEEIPLIILFNKPQPRLSIFQAHLLYMLFKLNKIPSDYAQYHKCIAGKKFIENIRGVKIS